VDVQASGVFVEHVCYTQRPSRPAALSRHHSTSGMLLWQAMRLACTRRAMTALCAKSEDSANSICNCACRASIAGPHCSALARSQGPSCAADRKPRWTGRNRTQRVRFPSLARTPGVPSAAGRAAPRSSRHAVAECDDIDTVSGTQAGAPRSAPRTPFPDALRATRSSSTPRRRAP